jgi:hypothetical protein
METITLLIANTAGFLIATGGIKSDNPAWLRLFQTAWFIGFLGAALVYYVVALISPPPGNPYDSELFGNEQDGFLEGHSPSGVDTPTDLEKTSISPSFKGLQN